MRAYGSKKNTREKPKSKWAFTSGKKPHGNRCIVCYPPDKISVSKGRARMEARAEARDMSFSEAEKWESLANEVKNLDVKIPAYGATMPLNQVAIVEVDGSELVVTVWDPVTSLAT